jgi:hypothetical protein
MANLTPAEIGSTKCRFSHPEVKIVARPRCGWRRVSNLPEELLPWAPSPISAHASASGALAAAATDAAVATSLKTKSPPGEGKG